MRPAGPLLSALVAVVLTATGCATGPPASPPTGIDGLVVPTPSPDPDDFVEGIDNPWFPFDPAQAEGTDEVAGVEVSVIDGEAYAQDRDGHVWWFGTEGVWEAGVDGAQAGLAMPAEPRYGDSWRLALAPGIVEDVAAVVELDVDSLVLEVTSPLEPGAVERRSVERAHR
ncbi:hypothetical protein [Nocardioides sp. SYSU DS0663]|uniref:hypothetical protein n=1 Tax=Nocardioides sp. SYSU DS0663 TaxID=3416445 RepID=UPI003F4C4019